MAAEHRLQATLGYEPAARTVSVGWAPHWSFSRAPWLELGAVLRANYFGGRNLSLETAEIAAIQQNETSTITEVSPHILALNLGISARVEPLEWIAFGFNLDLAGQSFGPQQVAVYDEAGFSASPSLQPTRSNLFLVALRDRGTLNSEFYVATPIDERWSLRLGLSHFFAEMTADTPLKYGGQRFRTIRDVFFVGVDCILP